MILEILRYPYHWSFPSNLQKAWPTWMWSLTQWMDQLSLPRSYSNNSSTWLISIFCHLTMKCATLSSAQISSCKTSQMRWKSWWVFRQRYMMILSIFSATDRWGSILRHNLLIWNIATSTWTNIFMGKCLQCWVCWTMKWPWAKDTYLLSFVRFCNKFLMDLHSFMIKAKTIATSNPRTVSEAVTSADSYSFILRPNWLVENRWFRSHVGWRDTETKVNICWEGNMWLSFSRVAQRIYWLQ